MLEADSPVYEEILSQRRIVEGKLAQMVGQTTVPVSFGEFKISLHAVRTDLKHQFPMIHFDRHRAEHVSCIIRA